MQRTLPEPPLPKQEEPVALLYRPKKHDDWGMIRTQDGELFAIVRRPIDNDEADRHRAAKTDPFEPLARRLMSTYTRPSLDARMREALEQIRVVCVDNAHASRKDMALRFIHNVAVRTLSSPVQSGKMDQTSIATRPATDATPDSGTELGGEG